MEKIEALITTHFSAVIFMRNKERRFFRKIKQSMHFSIHYFISQNIESIFSFCALTLILQAIVDHHGRKPNCTLFDRE